MKITINGKEIYAEEGRSVLQAALDADIYIPHLCTHPDLPVIAECGVCVAEINGVLCKTCETPAEDGMVVDTKSEAVIHHRNTALELMLASHPHDCSSCKAYLKCELQAVTQYANVTHSRLHTVLKKSTFINTENPLIVREMERCILCGRCVRACKDLRGVGILQYNKLGDETYIGTEKDFPLAEAGCKFCGACVEVCPTGALQDMQGVFRTDIPREQALVPCTAECPAHIDIPAYIRAVREGNYSEAVGIIREKVPFPHALGLVCNNRCENNCKHGHLGSAVSIRNLKRLAAEQDEEKIWMEEYLKVLPPTGKKVAIIGAGAAGLTAGYYLNRKGHDVTVFESKPIPGGNMTSGMPEYRIPTKVVLDEIKVIEDAGVRICCSSRIENVSELRKEYDAVLVAIGTSVGKKLNYLNKDNLPEVYSALDILQAQRLGTDITLGDSVCIIGGGNVAFDIAGTLIRMGKKTVNVVCLEKDASQADPSERDASVEEGTILYDSHSNEVIVGTDGHVSGLQVHKINSFYFHPETHELIEDPVPDSTYVIPCDSIVFAAGQVTGLTNDFGIEINRFGYPIDPETGKSEITTSVDGVFACGDVIRGSEFLIDAIADARAAAVLMDQYLGGDGNIENTLIERCPDPSIGFEQGFAELAREEMQIRPAQERKKDFKPESEGLSCEQGMCESGRCLQCDLRTRLRHVVPWTAYRTK